MKISFFIILSIFIAACGQPAAKVEEKAIADDIQKESLDQEIIYESPEKNEFMEFSASKENMSIRIRDWWKEVDKEKLGNPVDTTRKVLGAGADTHIGAAIHTFKYSDILLEFYGPKDGTDIWLTKMEITGSDWSTARGIHVGDSQADLTALYPKAENQTTNDPNLYRYQLEDSMLEFHVSDSKISKIDIIYNIP